MSKYIVEVRPGRELAYQTPLALRAAMRQGEINADSRILHQATSTWIPITEHPEYKRFLAEVYPPPWLAPPDAPEPVKPPVAPKQPGLLSSVAERGAALATSSWASLKKRIAKVGRRSERSSQPRRRLSPVSSAKPPLHSEPPAQPTEPPPHQSSDPTRNRWTFFP